jgi:hypothetical protein
VRVVTVTPAEQKKLVETVHERVVTILGPLGIVVSYEIPEKNRGGTAAEFTFKIPDLDASKPGEYQELTIHFMTHDAYQCKADPKQLDCLPRAWARICAEWAPSLFEKAPPPPADDVDWRPGEALPEDFYAA